MKYAFQVLIVDEDHELCLALSDLIIGAGYGVECLSGNENPYRAIREIAPDLIILDVSLPGVKGLETLRSLETHRATRKIPVIATSQQAELEYELLDAFDFLPKPLEQGRLLEDIELLAKGRESSALAAPYPPMEEDDLSLFQEYLVLHSGLHFDWRNSKILERGLMRRMRAVRAVDYPGYFGYLKKYGESRQEMKKLLALLTIGETYFFRYLAHFQALTQHVLPELISEKRPDRTLRVWSAGCSSGEEPYSIAMLLLEHFPQLADWDVEILATDINHRAIRSARQGAYRERALRVTEPLYREKYFQKHNGYYVLDPRVRDMVHFGYLNLQTGAFPSEENGTAAVDILFCRNVMIYFRLETVRNIVEKFSRCLRPGGHLFLGHAETLLNISESFQRVQNAGGFYYRLEDAAHRKPPPRAAPVLRPKVPSSPPPPVRRPPREVRPAPPEAPEPGLDEIFGRAAKAFDREDFVAAANDYDIILRRDARHLGALVGKGFILANQGRYAEALEFCRRALQENDLCPDAYFLGGLIREMGEELTEAVAEYRKALLLNMDFIMPHYNLSKLFWRMGRLGDARRELNNTLRLLEGAEEEALIPYSGGLSRAVFLEVCREDAARFGTGG